MRISTFFLFFSFVISLLVGCDKDAIVPEPQVPTPTNCIDGVPLTLRSSFRFNDALLNTSKAYRINDSTWIVLRDADIYISEIAFIKSNDAKEMQNSVQLVRLNRDSIFNLGLLEKGIYSGFRFSFGLNETLNHADPSINPIGHPLNFQVPSLHWSWNQGYIFARFEGSYGIDSLSAISALDNFSFHIGLDANYVGQIGRSMTFEVSSCTETTLRMAIQCEKLFLGMNLYEDNFSMSTSFPLVARKVKDNLETAFEIIP